MGAGHRAVIAALLAAGCNAGAGAGPPDADPFRPDADLPRCDEASATIGRCQVAGTGADCTGVPDEERVFSPLVAGESVPMVIGPQGARMFVLALRARAIEPGDPADPLDPLNPDVTITLLHGGAEMALYRGRPGFSPVTGDPDLYEVAGLFVIADGLELSGQSLRAVARLQDSNGEQRCGTVDFVAGS